jgi:hypothetical protein
MAQSGIPARYRPQAFRNRYADPGKAVLIFRASGHKNHLHDQESNHGDTAQSVAKDAIGPKA